VVAVADNELFGPDGTQSLDVPPLLSDPLGGLVTGFVFSDTTVAAPPPAQAAPLAAASPTQQARRRTAPVVRRPTGASAPGAMTPTATPVAASLPSRPKEIRRPTVARPIAMPVTPPVTNAPRRNPVARNPPAGGMTWQPPPSSRQAPTGRQAPTSAYTRSPSRRRAGLGCSMFVLIMIVLVAVFVVLGVVLGHGSTGFTGG
jgi:hypothetical protein